jgi:tetratricopeptide (TPR) repeat protein
VAEGVPEGEPREIPQSRWRDGWQLGTPDLVVMPRPYVLGAGGAALSRVFVFPVPVTTARYVRALEFRPGNSKVVLHADIRVDRTPASRQLEDADPDSGYEGLTLRSAMYPDGLLLGWAAGQIAPVVPGGMAWRLHPGTDFVVELHMARSGRSEVVAPSIGLYFTDDPPERASATLRLGRQTIDIAAGDKEYVSTDSFVLPVDVEVQAVRPHAHYRARQVSAMAKLPDGTTRSLIDIADWDFKWQHVYRFATPVALPKGTTLAMRYTYDNSADNPRNPERPPKRVQWGQRSRDEVGDLWIQVLTQSDGDLQTLGDAFQPKSIAEDIVGYETMIRRKPSRVLHDGVAELYLSLGRVNDAVSHFQASLKLEPASAATQFNVGTALTIAGRPGEAVSYYLRALALRPDYPLAHDNLGHVLMQLGHSSEAAAHFEASLRLDPTNAEAHYSAGSVAWARGELAHATCHFRQAVQLKPDWSMAVAALAWLLATAPDEAVRDAADAVRLGERAADLTGRREAEALDVLAAAYAAAGLFDQAIVTSQAALDLNPTPSLTADIRQRQTLYKQRKAYLLPR